MKRSLTIIGATVAGLIAGAAMNECHRTQPSVPMTEEVEVDTEVFVDTVRHLEARPSGEVSLGTRVIFLPGEVRPEVKVMSDEGRGGVEVRGQSDEVSAGDLRHPPDSVAVEIPITQREYEGEDYRAWVSGYDPRLDSLYVFPRRETVTIRETVCTPAPNHAGKQKRWGIGVSAGYGMTPQGMQPSIAISINYNLWTF